MTLITLDKDFEWYSQLEREDDNNGCIPTVSSEALASLEGSDLEKIEQLARFLAEYNPRIKSKYRYSDKKFCCQIDWLCRSAIAVSTKRDEAQSLALTEFIEQLQHPRNHKLDWENYYFFETFATQGQIIGFYGYFLVSALVYLYLLTQLQYLSILILLYPTGFIRSKRVRLETL